MKKLLLSLTGVILLISFNNISILSQTSVQTPREQVVTVLDKFHLSFGNRDTAALRSLITRTGIFCGTSPEEYTDDRDFALDYCMTDYFADTATLYSVTQREILMSPDNTSAIAMELFKYPPRSRWFDIRCNTHLIMAGGKWLIDSFTHSYVIPNADMEKVNELYK